MSKYEKARFIVGDKLNSIVETNYINELFQRATPKKVIYTNYKHDYIPPKCGSCDHSILDYGQKFCDNCGQRLQYQQPLEGQGEFELWIDID